MKRICFSLLSITVIGVFAFLGTLFLGAVDIPFTDVVNALTGNEVGKTSWKFIVLETRLPAACASLIAGASLAVAGLLLQTLFDNPLAGPSLLGISTGSSLGVALVMLSVGSVGLVFGQTAAFLGALAGAALVMAILVALSTLVKSSTMLLITGILIGYLASSAIALLNFFAPSEKIQSYVVWGLGSFNTVSLDSLPYFAFLSIILLASSLLFVKPLNAMLLGARYAMSAGVNVKSLRNWIMIISGALTAAVTAWCGPIGFIGLIVPHIARLVLKTSNHRILLPATVIVGAAVGALCQFVSVCPGNNGIIPINAITPIIGVPIIIYIIVKRRSISYFN